MDMLKGAQIAEARLTNWRKLAQGLHARYLVDDFGTGARFVTAVGEGAGTIVDDSEAPSLTVIADQDGNTGVVCVAESGKAG